MPEPSKNAPSPFAAVLGELSEEHGRAVAVHGFDAEHDARHSDADWAWRLLRRVSEVLAPETIVPSTPAERRRAFVELAHIAASAVAAHDLRQKVETLAADLGEHYGATTDEAVAALARTSGLTATSTDASWRYVTRPDGDGIERHTLTCTRWNATSGDVCPGEFGCWQAKASTDEPDHHEEPPT